MGVATVQYFAFFDIYVIYEYIGQNSKQVHSPTVASLTLEFLAT